MAGIVSDARRAVFIFCPPSAFGRTDRFLLVNPNGRRCGVNGLAVFILYDAAELPAV